MGAALAGVDAVGAALAGVEAVGVAGDVELPPEPPELLPQAETRIEHTTAANSSAIR